MLYDYKFTLAEMGQIKNWKKDNKFNYTLLNIEDIELSTVEIDCEIEYKKTIPLNIFEKYALRLIEKADKIYAEMNIAKIAQLLHLDESLIKENLENLEAIDMINGINSDFITINKDENSEYLQYENKFQIEKIKENYYLTNSEYENINNFIQKEFEKNSKNFDKKFQSISIKDEKESSKNINLLTYDDNNKFLIFSEDGINSQNDLKFIESDTFSNIDSSEKIPENIFCNYDEFLPLLRDMLSINKENIVLIGSKLIDKNNLDILKANKNIENVFILSTSDEKHNRIFNINIENFTWIEDEFYIKENKYIIKSKNNKLKRSIKDKLENYFLNKILEIEPSYSIEKYHSLNKAIENIKNTINNFEFKTKKEIDDEVKRINTEKNKLYGLTNKKKDIRKKIDKLEESNNEAELKKYPKYIKNRDEIFNLKDKVQKLSKIKDKINELDNELKKLNNDKLLLISKNNKSKIKLIEKELKKLKRLKI